MNWTLAGDVLQWFLIGYLLTRTVKKPRQPQDLGHVPVKRAYYDPDPERGDYLEH